MAGDTCSDVLLPSQLRATGPELLPGTTAGDPRWGWGGGGEGGEVMGVRVGGGEGVGRGVSRWSVLGVGRGEGGGGRRVSRWSVLGVGKGEGGE